MYTLFSFDFIVTPENVEISSCAKKLLLFIQWSRAWSLATQRRKETMQKVNLNRKYELSFLEIWSVTSQIWIVLLIGWSKFLTRHSQSKALPRSGQWRVISMEFLRSFLRRHFAGKPVVASWNVGCFLRLGGLGRVCATEMYRSIRHVEFPKSQTGIFVEWKATLVSDTFPSELSFLFNG